MLKKDNEHREIEIKVLDIDIKKMLSRLEKLGAKRIGEYNYKRIIYDYPDSSLDKKHAWIRLRTDGRKTTITYKKINGKGVDRIEEHETIVDRFDNARKILTSIGLEEKRTQESRRIMFELDSVEVDIDIWPKVPPYMEVEAKTKEELLKALKKLEIKIKDTRTFTGRELYAHYGITLEDFKDLKLEKSKRTMRI